MDRRVELFILPGLKLLPEKMTSIEAIAMLYAIGMQESRFEHRKQIGGPARGFWQFEEGGGIRGVLGHYITRPHIESVCDTLKIGKVTPVCYEAVTYNDQLAVCFARLLLFTIPTALPKAEESQKAWDYYTKAWRPGKPHRNTWDAFYESGWKAVV